MSRPRMLRGLLSFSSMTMVSRVLGLVRDIAITTVFGASAATDAFMIAFRVPNFMRRLFGAGGQASERERYAGHLQKISSADAIQPF